MDISSEGVEVAKVFQKEVENPVVVAPPDALVSKAVDEDGPGFMVHGVIVRVVARAGVVFIFFNREPHAKIDPHVLQGVHGRTVAFIAG